MDYATIDGVALSCVEAEKLSSCGSIAYDDHIRTAQQMTEAFRAGLRLQIDHFKLLTVSQCSVRLRSPSLLCAGTTRGLRSQDDGHLCAEVSGMHPHHGRREVRPDLEDPDACERSKNLLHITSSRRALVFWWSVHSAVCGRECAGRAGRRVM